jgi:hypothetical protein
VSKDVFVAQLINDPKLAIDLDNTSFKAMRKRARLVLVEKDRSRTISEEAKSMD